VTRSAAEAGSGAGASAAAPSPARLAWAVVAVCVAVSASVRAVVLHDLLAADPLLRVAVLDDRAYLAMARAVAERRGEPWFLAPLHPWIVAQASRFADLGLPLACGVNAVLGVVASALAAAAGCALHSRAAGLAAGLLHALSGVFVFHDVLPGQEPALTALHLAGLLIAVRAGRAGGPGTFAALGACAGVAALGRATSVALVLLAVPAWLRSDRRRRVLAAAACAAGLLLVLGLASSRNASVAGDFTPFPWSGGPNLYAANGPDARATVAFHAADLGADPDAMALRARAVVRGALGREPTPGEIDAWWRSRAWRERGDAGEWLLHHVRKAALFWTWEERGSTHSSAAEREFSGLLGWTPDGAWWILAAGAAAWWVVRPRVPVADGVALTVAGTWALLVVVFPVARYRLPVAALCCPVVACAAVEAVRRTVAPRRLAVSGGLFAAAAALAFAPVRPPSAAGAHVNVAAAHLEAGDPRPVAVRRLRRALAEDPRDGPANELMGRLAFVEGDASGAYAHLCVAAGDRRSRWGSQVAAVRVLVALGRADEARRVARGLLTERRDDPELLVHASLAAAAAGDAGDAERLRDEARALAPDHPAVRALGSR
jgi:hypothetical protein